MTLIPKHKPLRDKKYRNSFKIEGKHKCWITGADMPDAAHIRQGCYSIGMKPDDNLIIPLAHYLHLEQHAIGEEQFLIKYFKKFPQERRDRAIDVLMEKDNYDGRYSGVEVIKQCAIAYYEEFLYNDD